MPREMTLERVASAIGEAIAGPGAQPKGGWLRAARAALQAAREPSEAVVEIVAKAVFAERFGLCLGEKWDTTSESDRRSHRDIARAALKATPDAILNEKPDA